MAVSSMFNPSSGRRDQSALFEALRLKVDCHSWRISPSLPLLSQIKRLIAFAYTWRFIGTQTTQRLIDFSRCWEA
jgi:hypothetical protein